MENRSYDLNYFGESSQEELAAYRKLGSVKSLGRLKQQELKRRRRRKRMTKIIEIAFLGVCLTFLTWLIASWADVILHSTHPNPVFQDWNFFTLFS